jgi:hypothetical protein
MDSLTNLAVVLTGLVLGSVAFGGCSSSAPNEPETPAEAFVIRESPCVKDQARFYYCDSLLPTVANRVAPEPFDKCPGYIDIPEGVNAPVGTVAAFSPSQTDAARRRITPGHSCCYSWCAKIKIADESDAQPAEECVARGVTRESYCIREPEGETSGSHAGAPYDRCPAALTPPEEVAYSAPKAARLDVNETAQRRSQGTPDCCYAWCSQVPYGIWAKPSAPKD